MKCLLKKCFTPQLPNMNKCGGLYQTCYKYMLSQRALHKYSASCVVSIFFFLPVKAGVVCLPTDSVL